MNKFTKILLGIIIVFIPASLLLGYLLSSLTQKSFYINEGSVNLKGLGSEVKVYSDSYGVPHIIAMNESDIYFALGYMHAQDRLWQMDLTRRVAEGRLSEIFGSVTLDFDRLFRTIGIDRFSYTLFEKISPKSKQILEDYSKGVNQFIENHKHELPVEFDLLNYEPGVWKPQYSLMLVRLMGWELNLAWYTDYILGKVINKAGIEKVSEIFPDTSITLYKRPTVTDTLKADSLEEHTSIPELSNFPESGMDFFSSYSAYRKFFGLECTNSGSNSWVISGIRSESGMPLLANDPHLALQAPSKWYEVHIKSPGFDVTGMSLPGMPGITIGHNRSISWGLTNLMNDDCDFFLLSRDSADKAKYVLGGKSYNLDSLVEKIYVKDSGEVRYTVKLTKIGPAVSELRTRGFISETQRDNIYKNKILTFKWTGFDFSDEVNCFYKINRATNWEQFKEGLRDFGVPAQNFIYADTGGNIGYHAAGKIPIRTGSVGHPYLYPLTSNYEWTGFIEFDDLPEQYNPDEGYIVTANTNPAEWLKGSETMKYYISYVWEPASRYNRVKEVLKSGKILSIDEFKLLQMSYRSPYASEMSVYIVNAFNKFITNQYIADIINRFRNWNGEMNYNDVMGSIYNAFLMSLLKNIYVDELGEDMFFEFLTIQNWPLRSTLSLMKNYHENSSGWIDNVNTTRKETRDEIIRESLSNAIDFLKARFETDDVNLWYWGHLHKVTFKHPLGSVPALSASFNIGPYEVGGDQTTVNCSEFSFKDAVKDGNFNNSLGASMRIIVDFSDITHSLSVNSTGQSGQPVHPNYADQSRLWLFGDYKTMTMDELEMINDNLRLLVLNPEN
jgi:penicillin amidase